MPTWKSVCEVWITTPPTNTTEWTATDWADNLEDLIHDAMGAPFDTNVIVRTIKLEKEE